MSTHITPPPRADQTGLEAAEPARRAARFDERGIALQTIIILVVMLAIAGAVAAVILTRAGEETSNLEETDSAVYGIENATGCRLGGGTWVDPAAKPTDEEAAALNRAGVTASTATALKFCKP